MQRKWRRAGAEGRSVNAALLGAQEQGGAWPGSPLQVWIRWVLLTEERGGQRQGETVRRAGWRVWRQAPCWGPDRTGSASALRRPFVG